MALDASTTQRADKIAHRFFTKFALVVDNARIPDERRDTTKKDEWFGLETPDIAVYRDLLGVYRNISAHPSPPSLELQLFLVIPELNRDQLLVHNPPNSSRILVDPTPTHILLESWLCCLIPYDSHGTRRSPSSSSNVAGDSEESSDVTLPTVYKHSISLFRSLYTLLRVLPAWKLCNRYRRRTGGNSSLSIDLRARLGDVAEDPNVNILGFDTPLSSTASPSPSSEHVFAPVHHPYGNLSISVRYLTEPHFAIDTRESLLSSHILSQAWDGANAFTPTIASARSRDREGLSGIGSGLGSLPARMSLPRSPPRQVAGPSASGGGAGIGFSVGTASGGGVGASGMSGRETPASIVDRFVLPSGNASRTSLSSAPNTSPLARMTPLPGTSTTALPLPTPGQRASPSRAGAADAFVGSAGSAASSTRLSAEGYRSAAGIDLSTISTASSRGRRESTGRGSNVDLPSAPVAVAFPSRRPSLNTIHPFKSGSLVSTGSPHSPAPSLRHGSPLPTIPARMPTTYDSRTLTGAGPSQPFPISPGQMMRSPSSPVAPLRPSPPFAPSSFDREKRFSASGIGSGAGTGALPSSGESASAAGEQGGAPRRKRYSSSFGHRYAAAGLAGSDGSAGSGEREGIGLGRERKDSERGGGASYLSANPDDDDLSAFVQDIDARAPLGGNSSPGAAAPSQHSRQVARGLGIERIGSPRERTTSELSGEDAGLSRAGVLSRQSGERILGAGAGATRFGTEVPRRTGSITTGAPDVVRERTMSEGSHDAGRLQMLSRVGRGGETVDERLERLNKDFQASLANLEWRGPDKGTGEEREREGSSAGGSVGGRRHDLPTSPTQSSGPRMTLPSAHGRTSSLSEQPLERPALRHGRYTTDAITTLTSLAPPSSSRRTATTPPGPPDRVRDYDFGASTWDARTRDRERERDSAELRIHRQSLGGLSAGSGGSASGSNSNSNSGYASGLVPGSGVDAARPRAPSRLSSESGGASGGRSGASSEFVGGRMDLGS